MATHEEMITPLKFNESFKKMIRDFYCYGFKNLNTISGGSESTIKKDWIRLNNILARHQYMTWTEDIRKIMFSSMDSTDVSENPFHDVYRFCESKHFDFLLQAMAALSPKIKIREEYLISGDSPFSKVEDILRENMTESDSSEGSYIEKAKKTRGLKTSEFLYFCPECIIPESNERNKTANIRLNALKEQGLIQCNQRKGKQGGSGDKYWKIASLTLRELIQKGKEADDEFENHFLAAIDFYSRYFVLGEVGAFILDRFRDCGCRNEQISERTESLFRFKQDYLIQAVNDFDLIDILEAIESRNWCRIKCRNGFYGVNAYDVDILCFPLELRISMARGREHLMYYDPVKRCCTSLRLDFILSIQIYDDDQVKTALARSNQNLSSVEIENDIANAENLLQHTWGVSTSPSKKRKNNVVGEQKLSDLRMSVTYDPVNESYIATRFRRESRFGTAVISEKDGTIDFSVKAGDSVELHPWIRSFISRIISLEGFSSNKPRDSKQIYQDCNLPEDLERELGKGRKPKGHELLFNETFSVYSRILADMFTAMLTRNGEWDEKEWQPWFNQTLKGLDIEAGFNTGRLWRRKFGENTLREPFLAQGPTGRTIKMKYVPNEEEYAEGVQKENISFYADILPFTDIEVRWLKTILKDEDKIGCFFSQKEISSVSDFLNNGRDVSELPADKIKYYDRYYFPEENKKREEIVLQILQDSMRKQKKVNMTFLAATIPDVSSDIFMPLMKDDGVSARPRHKLFEGKFIPIEIIFSKRNNFFTAYFVSCEDNRVYFLNISRIRDISETDESFSDEEKAASSKRLEEYFKQETMSVEVEFNGEKNKPDRILMEFSPWEKECTFNEETKKYRLKIYYLKTDEWELTVRLMGYLDSEDGFIITDSDHPIAKDIRERREKQRELLNIYDYL